MAPALRSVADQTPDELGGPASLLLRQRRDHAVLEDLLDRLTARGEEQEELLTALWRLVFPHAYAEETVVWPVLRRELPDGEALTLRLEQEHREVNRPHGNGVAALPLAVLDRSRDALERSARRSSGSALARRAAGRGLATVAGAVERVPLLRQGERPSTSAEHGAPTGERSGSG